MNRKNFMLILLTAVLIVPVGFTKVEPLAGQEINHVTKNLEKGQLLNSSSPEFSSFTLPPALRHRTNQPGSEPEILKKTPQITQEINTPTAAAGWMTIMSENFESSFPGNTWQVRYNGTSSQSGYGYTWDDDDFKPHTGNYSAWCADQNYTGKPDLDPQSDNYPNNLIALMIYGPFSLSDATDAELLFYYWNQSETNYDYFGCMASIDGNQFYGKLWSGSTNNWISENFDLTNVYTLGNLCGKNQVWITFVFQSDGSNTYKGAFVDDIVLQKYVTPPIMVTSPNGGEIWDGGSTHNITWISDGTSGTVKIEYSTNGGTTWTNIVTSTADDGSYTWTVPRTSSTSCLVRISDTDGSPSDQSDRTFEIRVESITVTAPNGGEIWTVGSTQNITWFSSGTSGNFKIEYSTNNGSAWTTITANTSNAGTYAWTLPNTPSAYCFVKVSDADGYPSDQSDGNFTIKPAEPITVTSPNGGEIWAVASTQNINWTSSNTSGNVKIEYSTNNGSSWATITSNTPNDGTHAWTVPNAPSKNCLIKITHTTNGQSDQSDRTFTIGFITVTAPNGGEVWGVGSNQNITWTSGGTSGNVKIDYSTNSGSTWSTIQSSTPDDGNHTWTIPNTPTTTATCLVKISDTNGSLSDQSNNPFTIQAAWKVTITINGGNTSFTRSFGGNTTATDGYDTGSDVITAPPAMPYYAYFDLGTYPNYLETDIRRWVSPYTAEITWSLKIVNATGITSNLSWNTANFPSVTATAFTLIGAGADVNMRTKNSATVTGSANLIIKYGSTSSTAVYTFPQRGWYLISLPVTPTNSSLSALFPTAVGAYSYSPATGNYNAVTTLEPRKGYWLLMPGVTTANISGVPVTTYSAQYIAGWHLIGTVKGGANFTDPKDTPNNSVIAAYGYSTTTGQYVSVYPPGTGVLEEKQGYWLGVAQTCDLTIGGSDANPTSIGGKGDMAAFYRQFGTQPPAPPVVANFDATNILSPGDKITSRNYPNPFNPETMITYSLPQSGFTQILIYNEIGQKIRTLIADQQTAGVNQVRWDGRNENGELAANGIYFYQIINAGVVECKKILFLK